MWIHLLIRNPGGVIQRLAEVLQRHVERNVNEVLLGGGSGAGKVQQRVNAESRVESLTARAGDGLSRLTCNHRTRGTCLESDEENRRDSRSNDQCNSEHRQENELLPVTRARRWNG